MNDKESLRQELATEIQEVHAWIRDIKRHPQDPQADKDELVIARAKLHSLFKQIEELH
jgi:hypothetical protein